MCGNFFWVFLGKTNDFCQSINTQNHQSGWTKKNYNFLHFSNYFVSFTFNSFRDKVGTWFVSFGLWSFHWDSVFIHSNIPRSTALQLLVQSRSVHNVIIFKDRFLEFTLGGICILKIYIFLYVLHRPAGRAITRSSLEREVWGSNLWVGQIGHTFAYVSPLLRQFF